MTHNLKVDANAPTTKAVAAAVNHAVATLGVGALLATSMFPNAPKRNGLKLAA